MEDETVFGCVVLCLEGAEKSLFSTENLDGTCWVLGKSHQTSGVSNETSSDKFANKSSKVRSDSVHSVCKVGIELCSIL